MMVNGTTIKSKVLAFIEIQKGKHTKELLKTANIQASEFKASQLGIYTKDSTKAINSKAKEFINGRMVQFMKDFLARENVMDKEYGGRHKRIMRKFTKVST